MPASGHGAQVNATPKHLVVVGLSHPFRGGIAHYSTLLVRTLRRRYRTRFITLCRQYPGFLFPGKTQYDRSAAPIVEGNEAIIDSMNPLTWWRTARLLCREDADLIVFNWWQPFFGLAFGAILQLMSRSSRRKACFLCHNVLPHERHTLERLLCQFAFRHVRYFIVHSEADKEKLLSLKPAAIVQRNCHPTYSTFSEGQVYDKASARRRLGLPADRPVVLFFGLVRPYKGLAYLIEALPEVRRHVDCLLLVVGEFYDDKDQYTQLIEQRGLGQHIRVIDQYVHNEDVALYFGAADVVVLPYIEATQSGIVQIAYGCGTPVITTRVGGLPEAVEDGRTGFLVDARSAEQLAAAIVNYYQGGHEEPFRENIRQQSGRFDWDEEVSSIERFMARAAAE